MKNTSEILLFERMEKNSKLLRTNYPTLQKEYGESYIAIDEGKVIASKPTLDSLREYLEEKKIELTTVIVQYIPKKGVIILY